jgi:glycosyltransferase involved in cell wall biosynthesis
MNDITVIIPFFNEDSTLRTTMDSLIAQKYKPAKVLMVDSGSTDKSADIINEYTDYKDISIELLQPMLGSPSSSINYGIKLVKTTYVAYIDCGLIIPANWLNSQYKLLNKNNDLIVSTQIYTDGQDIIDKSLIAQTYGYKNKTTCLPGSLIDIKLFNIVGLFEDNMRAGYDVDFINRLKQKSIKRLVNKRISLKYIGINYAKDYISAAKKVFNYSLSGWKTESDYKPFLYMFFIFLIFFSISSEIFLKFLFLYLVVRGYVSPFIKSKHLFDEKNIYFYLALPITAIVFDISRSMGYLLTLKRMVMNTK